MPERKKGERLVVLYTELAQTPEQIRRGSRPSAASALDSLALVFAASTPFPCWTGKLDLKRVKDVAGGVQAIVDQRSTLSSGRVATSERRAAFSAAAGGLGDTFAANAAN